MRPTSGTLVLRQNPDANLPGCNVDDEGENDRRLTPKPDRSIRHQLFDRVPGNTNQRCCEQLTCQIVTDFFGVRRTPTRLSSHSLRGSRPDADQGRDLAPAAELASRLFQLAGRRCFPRQAGGGGIHFQWRLAAYGADMHEITALQKVDCRKRTVPLSVKLWLIGRIIAKW
jgi:hypothetical protein